MTKTKRSVRMPAGVRNKMMAAVSMLLVSSIMLVSSTYAWFTLSTAPEVTGIETSVAGNGSLEIALMPANGLLGNIRSGRSANGYDGSVAVTTANTTWGNIINLSDESYGLNKVNLNPAAWHTEERDGRTYFNEQHILDVASYGYDGRVEKLDNVTVVNKSYDGSNLFNGAGYGVRAIGEPKDDGSLGTTYGYIIDLAVRLNSTKDNGTPGKLLLQSDPAQRIYAEGQNEATLGGGSYMTFADTNGLDVVDLMKAVRVTFVYNLANAGTPHSPDNCYTVGTARLDTDNKTAIEGGGGYTAKLYLMDGSDLVTTQADAVLLNELAKNAATQISAIVWLDGSQIKNSSVSAFNTALPQATLNLQFATDVTLRPVVNTALKVGDATAPANVAAEAQPGATPEEGGA